MRHKILLGVDTGGTFTDFVLLKDGRLHIHKQLSTPDAPEQAILRGIEALGLVCDENLAIIHGSTVATNLVLENKGVPTAYVTNQGFKDVLAIGRQARQHLYQLQPRKQPPPVPADLCFEVSVRMNADGSHECPLDIESLETLARAIADSPAQAVAINLLYAYLDDTDEQAIAHYLKQYFRQHHPQRSMYICHSAAILREYKEYERGMVTWLNACVGPKVKRYIQVLQQHTAPAELTIMQSSGGTLTAAQAADNAVRLLLSGPAGGLIGAKFIAEKAGFDRLLTFDMGGTSTDVALIDGEISLGNHSFIRQYPVAIPMVDMHTIGAGGGSIAYVDAGGILQVGPQSAGAKPGPACYDQGGNRATVTDANLFLGRIPRNCLLGGSLTLDYQRAEQVIRTLAQALRMDMWETARGIIRLANEQMSQALRVMSVQKGIDPGRLCLVPFGGAGGLHVCALADSLQMRQILIPVHGGVLSALGMVAAPRSRDYSQTCLQQLLPSLSDASVQKIQQEIQLKFNAMADEGMQELTAEGLEADRINVEYSFDVRYIGQSYSLNIALNPKNFSIDKITEQFHQLHQDRYGHRYDQGIELVNYRLRAFAYPHALDLKQNPETDENDRPQVDSWQEVYGIDEKVPVYARENLSAGCLLQGPLIIVERIATHFIEASWSCRVDVWGNLIVEKLNSDG